MPDGEFRIAYLFAGIGMKKIAARCQIADNLSLLRLPDDSNVSLTFCAVARAIIDGEPSS